MSDIARVVPKDVSSDYDLAAMTMMVYSVPRRQKKCQALVVFPGMGETWRLEQVIAAWENQAVYRARHLLVAGTEWKIETTNIRPPIIKNLKRKPYLLRRMANVHAQDHAHHTREQAVWVVEMVQKLRIKTLALFVSPYHLLRAYLTLLKTFINVNIPPVKMIPVPVNISPDTIIPETGTDAWSLVQGEMLRIKAYQHKGDVATLEELQQYLSFLWKE